MRAWADKYIEMDPPYGVKWFRAYRDTWAFGTVQDTFLSDLNLRDRLLLAKDLLSRTGSIFELMEEIFGPDNP